MECDVCRECKDETKEIYSCDRCKEGLCKACGGLTSSEIKVLQLRERVMLFHCEQCRNVDTFKLLQNTINDKASIITSKEEIINLLKEKIKELESTKNNLTPIPTISYSGMVKKSSNGNKNVVINNVPSLIIKPKRQQTLEKTEKDLKNKINPAAIKISIKSTRSTTNGNIIIKCPNRDDIEILKREADAKLPDYDVQILKLRKPRVKIIGYKGDLEKNDLERCLRVQNQFICNDDELEVTFIRRNPKNKVCTIFMECSPKLYHNLMVTKKIFIGWERYPVYEDVSISRCFNCQEHYHKTEGCESETVCEYCSLNHNVSDCPKTRQKCINCVKANNKYKTEYCTNHTANDPTCPSYQYLINVLRSKIDYGNQN